MGGVRRYLPAMVFGGLAVLGFVAALVAAYDYGEAQTAPHAPFLLLEKTYSVLLPFLLTTVAVGAAGVAYSVVLRLREKAELEAQTARTRAAQGREAEQVRRAAVVRRLREIYEDSLRLMYDVRLSRQRLRIMAVKGDGENDWRLRRCVFDELVRELSSSALNGRRLANMLKFDAAALYDGEPPAHMLNDLQSQVGAIFGILKDVLDDMDFIASTQGATDPEALVPLPSRLVAYAHNATDGNASFRKGAEQFDTFVGFVMERLRQMEQPLPPAP